jgi:excinuclease UvrABC nuclease subunit
LNTTLTPHSIIHGDACFRLLQQNLGHPPLYRHFDKDGNLLYVGVSLNAIERTISHRDKSHWYQDIARIEIEWLHSRSAAYYAEKKAIQSEHPRYNIRDASPS